MSRVLFKAKPFQRVNPHCVSAVPPSPELVERVRDLYHKRVPDVRFLIPVINGLEKVSFCPPHDVLHVHSVTVLTQPLLLLTFSFYCPVLSAVTPQLLLNNT